MVLEQFAAKTAPWESTSRNDDRKDVMVIEAIAIHVVKDTDSPITPAFFVAVRLNARASALFWHSLCSETGVFCAPIT